MVVLTLISDYQLWKFTESGKLLNKALDENWMFGNSRWEIRNNYIVSKFTEAVISFEGGILDSQVSLWYKHGGSNQKWKIVPHCTDWIKLKNAKNGQFLHSSKCGQKLSTRKGDKGICDFFLKKLNNIS